MRFELFIATRYLRAKRRQAFIGIITGISIVGVAAGVASLIVALAINNGFRQDLQERLIGSTSHVSLLRIADDGIKDWPPLLERLSKRPQASTNEPKRGQRHGRVRRGPVSPPECDGPRARSRSRWTRAPGDMLPRRAPHPAALP